MAQIKKTPFYEVGLEAGAEMREIFGYYLPLEYKSGHYEEHVATRERASLCDLHYMGEISVEGPEATALVQNLCTSDISTKQVGSVKYTTFCNDDGLMVDDGTVWRLGPDQYLIITGDEQDYEWVKLNAAKYDVEINNITDEHTTLALQGPKSKAVLEKLTDIDLDAIRYYRFMNGNVNNIDCIVARMGYTGEFGYELHFNAQYARDMWLSIMDAGLDINITPLGQIALESLRQEAGYLLVGNDHDKLTNPFEAGLGAIVDISKEDFNGKHALANILSNGVKRTLVWFRIPDGAVAVKGDPIISNSKKIGEITSGSYSPTFRKGTAIGYVKPEYAMHGALYSIKIDNESHSARLSLMPLYDPDNIRTTNKQY